MRLPFELGSVVDIPSLPGYVWTRAGVGFGAVVD